MPAVFPYFHFSPPLLKPPLDSPEPSYSDIRVHFSSIAWRRTERVILPARPKTAQISERETLRVRVAAMGALHFRPTLMTTRRLDRYRSDLNATVQASLTCHVQSQPQQSILSVLDEYEFLIAPLIFTLFSFFTRMYKIGLSPIVTWDEAQ